MAESRKAKRLLSLDLNRERRITEDEDISIASIKGYNLEVDHLREKYKESRTGIYIKDNLIYERVTKFEAELSSTVCIKVGFKKTRKIYICGFYRQFTINHKDEKMKQRSQSKVECDRRFEIQAELWENLIKEKSHNEIFICGDFNFCTIQQKKPEWTSNSLILLEPLSKFQCD